MFKLVVLSCLLACSSAQFLLPGFGTHLLGAWDGNYRGPLSLAPGQPASILGADGRPLDTLDVNLDKSAHLTAKAFEGSGIHLLKKRSLAFAAPYPHYTTSLAYSAPVATYGHYATAYTAPLTTYGNRLIRY